MYVFAYSSIYFVGLSWGTDDQSLRDAFATFGDVVDGKLQGQMSAALFSIVFLSLRTSFE